MVESTLFRLEVSLAASIFHLVFVKMATVVRLYNVKDLIQGALRLGISFPLQKKGTGTRTPLNEQMFLWNQNEPDS